MEIRFIARQVPADTDDPDDRELIESLGWKDGFYRIVMHSPAFGDVPLHMTPSKADAAYIADLMAKTAMRVIEQLTWQLNKVVVRPGYVGTGQWP